MMHVVLSTGQERSNIFSPFSIDIDCESEIFFPSHYIGEQH